MPVLAGLMKKGSFGRLSTIRPTISQIIWTSIATGKSPAKHGIDALLKKTDGGRGERLFSGEDRRTKALWNIFSDYGLTVNSIGWWKTWPAEEVTGVMVPQLNLLYSFDASGLGIFQPDRARSLQDLVQPAAFLDKVDSTARDVDASVGSIAGNIFGRFRHPQSEFGKYALPRMRWILAMDEMHYRIARDVLSERGPGDLTMVYFRGADVLAHAFWRFTYPQGFADQPTKDEIENYAGIIPGYYRHMDSLLGSLIEAAGAGATVIVVSDHGMGPSNVDASFTPGQGTKPESKSGDHEDAPPGIFIAAGPYIGTGVPGGREAGGLPAALDYATLPKVGSVYDLAPTILALKGLPVGKDMDGKVLGAILVPSFLTAHPVATVATHDTGGWPAGRAEYHLSDEQVKERIEELRSIGYIK